MFIYDSTINAILGVLHVMVIDLGNVKINLSVFELNNVVTDGLIVMMGLMNMIVPKHAVKS